MMILPNGREAAANRAINGWGPQDSTDLCRTPRDPAATLRQPNTVPHKSNNDDHWPITRDDNSQKLLFYGEEKADLVRWSEQPTVCRERMKWMKHGDSHFYTLDRKRLIKIIINSMPPRRRFNNQSASLNKFTREGFIYFWDNLSTGGKSSFFFLFSLYSILLKVEREREKKHDIKKSKFALMKSVQLSLSLSLQVYQSVAIFLRERHT